MATSHRQAPLVGSDHISGWHIGNTIETFDLCHILGDPELALHKIESLFFHIRDIHKFPHLSRWEHGHHFQMDGFSLKVEQVSACTHECSQRGEEFKPWLVQGQTSIIINYWCFCLMNFQELPCAHLALMKAIIRWKVLQETWGGHTRQARQEPGRPWAPWSVCANKQVLTITFMSGLLFLM